MPAFNNSNLGLQCLDLQKRFTSLFFFGGFNSFGHCYNFGNQRPSQLELSKCNQCYQSRSICVGFPWSQLSLTHGIRIYWFSSSSKGQLRRGGMAQGQRILGSGHICNDNSPSATMNSQVHSISPQRMFRVRMCIIVSLEYNTSSILPKR